MKPRLKSSKKWSPLPKELLAQIQTVFKQSFAKEIEGGRIEAGGRIYPEEILLRVGFKPPGSGLKQANWDVSIAYKANKDNVVKLLHLGVDAVGSLFEQTFGTEDDHDFPRIWQEVDFEGRTIFIQYVTDNTQLEHEANKLLGLEEGEELVGGEWDDDSDITPEDIKKRLGVDGDDDDDNGGVTH